MPARPDLHLPARRRGGPSSATADGSSYSDAESEFIRAVVEFRAVNRINSPTVCHYLWILQQLGYAKAVSVRARSRRLK